MEGSTEIQLWMELDMPPGYNCNACINRKSDPGKELERQEKLREERRWLLEAMKWKETEVRKTAEAQGGQI
jgi:hypothetical protein